MSVLRAEGVEITVAGRCLCRGVQLAFEPGESWAILGGNGSGKTTLLQTLCGLRPPAAGTITLNDEALSTLSRRAIAQRLGLLLQESHDSFPSTVLETALSGRHPHLGRWQDEGEEGLTLARDSLTAMGLGEFETRMVQTLSGGERRRLAIATLLTQAPELMLLDEPLNHLDLHHQQQLLQLLQERASSGGTIIMVLHDPNQAMRYCDKVLMLYGDGGWESGECKRLLTEESLSRLYHHPMQRLDYGERSIFVPA